MLHDRIHLFIGRRKAIALFKLLYKHDWRRQKLLPILLLLAPHGGGVSMLIDFLQKKCETSIPYAILDGAQADAPRTFEELLERICNQLVQPGNGPKLRFPRYHLGVSVISDALSDNNQERLSNEIKELVIRSSLSEKIDDMIATTSNQSWQVTLVLVVLKWLLPFFLRILPNSSLRWYQDQRSVLRMSTTSDGFDVLMRLRNWSRPNNVHGHSSIVENILFDAFLEDLRKGFDVKKSSKAKDRTTHVVLFLKHFDNLPEGGRFLSLLVQNRSKGAIDPLLVVVGSQRRLFNTSYREQHPPFIQEDERIEEKVIEENVTTLYHLWYEQLLPQTVTQEPQLYIPIWLQDFDMDATVNVLRMLDYDQTGLFKDEDFVEAIYRITYGHPQALTLAARTFLEAKANGRNLNPYELLRIPTRHYHAQDRRDFLLGEQLFDILLKGIPGAARKQLVFCVVPRKLTPDTLRVALALNDDTEAKRIWDVISTYTFARIDDPASNSLQFHPLLQSLLMQHLVLLSEEKGDDYKVAHTNLRQHFTDLALYGDEQARIEESYHALALGDPTPAIADIDISLANRDRAWEKTIEIVEQAPTIYMPLEIKQQARDALYRVRSNMQSRDLATALVLYTWLAHIPYIDKFEYSDVLYNLADIYRQLVSRGYPTCLEKANQYLQQSQALMKTNSPEKMPVQLVSDITPFPIRKINKTWRRVRMIATILLLIAPPLLYSFLYLKVYVPQFCNPVGFGLNTVGPVINSLYLSHGIFVTHARDGECIGLSDGNFAFDTTTNQESGQYKKQASEALHSGDTDDAEVLWNEARQIDTSDAETLIYQENQRVLNLVNTQHFQYVTIVILTMLTANDQDQKSVATGRGDLQGAYVAQIEHNKDFRVPLIRILIANSGGNTAYAPEVTTQIIQAASVDRTIIGVVGPSQSRDKSIEAIKMLGKVHIPIISSTASSDALTNISSYFFRVAPPNRYQVAVGVQYAEHVLHVKTAVLFEALNDNYSQSLAADFIEKFQKIDHKTIVQTETFDAQDIDVSNTIHDKAVQACSYNPDMIYFTGRSDAMIRLLNSLNPCGANTVKIMGGDTLDLLTSAPDSGYPRYAYDRLYYTSFAFPQEWEKAGLSQFRPSFFDDYPRYFDPNNQHNNPPTYGYTLADGHVILAYDAMMTLQQAAMDALKRKISINFSPQDVRDALSRMSGKNAMQGASGCIDFGSRPNGDPVNKVVVMLKVDSHSTNMLVRNGILGSLRKTAMC